MDFDTTVKIQDRISDRWDLPFSFFSVIGSVEVTGLIWLGLLILVLFKRYFLTTIFFLSFVIGLAIELFGKLFLLHPSPPHLFYRGVLDLNFPSHYVTTSYSYPSGHMLRTSFLVSFLILFLYFESSPRGSKELVHFKVSSTSKVLIQLGLLAFLVVMFISRIALGEHWVTDVIGGTLLGSSLGTLSALTVPAKAKKIEN